MLTGWQVQLTDGLLALLGLDDSLGGQWLEGSYRGDSAVTFAITKTLCVHMEQMKTIECAVDGASSTALATIGIRPHAHFSETATVRFEFAEFIRLQGGFIQALAVTIRDDKGRPIDNHGLPISVMHELRHSDKRD